MEININKILYLLQGGNKIMTKRKDYSEEDLYKLILAVENHPGQSAGSINFWNYIVIEYGEEFWGFRKADALRCKWRKIQKEVK